MRTKIDAQNSIAIKDYTISTIRYNADIYRNNGSRGSYFSKRNGEMIDNRHRLLVQEQEKHQRKNC